MLALTETQAAVADEDDLSAEAAAYSEDLMELFLTAQETVEQPDMRQGRIVEELECWMCESSILRRTQSGAPESVLSFWRREYESGSYVFLPRVARVLFSVPASSAQIERDFGVSGMIVTAQRSSIAPHNVDMCSFLNRNSAHEDIMQCRKVKTEDLLDHIPSNVLVNIQPSEDEDFSEVLATCFSNSSFLDDGESQT